MPSQSVERREPITGLIMIVMSIISIVGLMWCIKHGIEESPTSRHTINKPLNK